MPLSKFENSPESYRYLNGLGCYHESEAVEGALPISMNSPQKPAFGLYTEKLSGTAFTVPRHESLQTWMYRIMPSVSHAAFTPVPYPTWTGETSGISSSSASKLQHTPNQYRWDPFEIDESLDFVQGLRQVAGAGDPTQKQGLSICVYSAGKDMPPNTAFYSCDGDLLLVPQQGSLDIQTELGCLLVRPNEICMIPRGLKYRVTLPSGPVRGYALEIYEGHFQLPELGPIGSACLASPRDFQVPVAHFDIPATSTDTGTSPNTPWTILTKYASSFFLTTQPHTPFNVVAWHGTNHPYKYDLSRFTTLGSISHDHPDPSIFTVLTCPSAAHPGTAIADFLIFPPRWLVAENTFRPPWYHRNVMSEFMGLICGDYDAKKSGEKGFQPGGASLHNVMAGHGPDAGTFEKASEVELRPVKVGEGSMAFMFESCYFLGVSEWALSGRDEDGCGVLQEGYVRESWGGLRPKFELKEGMRVLSNSVDSERNRPRAGSWVVVGEQKQVKE